MQLLETRQQLDTTKVTCHNLEEELTEKETFYKCRETKLQEFHAEEISKGRLESNFYLFASAFIYNFFFLILQSKIV